MNQSLPHGLSVFMGLFAIMNPIANTPVFLALTEGDDSGTRRKVAAKALIITFAIVAVFAVTGKWIFDLFEISLSSFRIMGGGLVTIVGYQMLHGGEQSSVQHPSREDARNSLDAAMDVAITPLAMPILAGPGTIATAMSFASGGGVRAVLVTVGAFFVLCIISYAFFVSGERFVRYLGGNGIKVVTRLMGLILGVIGIEMLINGIMGAVRNFPNT